MNFLAKSFKPRKLIMFALAQEFVVANEIKRKLKFSRKPFHDDRAKLTQISLHY